MEITTWPAPHFETSEMWKSWKGCFFNAEEEREELLLWLFRQKAELLVLRSNYHTSYCQLFPLVVGDHSVREEGGMVCLEYKPVVQCWDQGRILYVWDAVLGSSWGYQYPFGYIMGIILTFMELTWQFYWYVARDFLSYLTSKSKMLHSVSVICGQWPQKSVAYTQPCICS